MSARFMKGLLFGSVIGAAGGLLFAPKKGQETQAELKQVFDEGLANVQMVQQDVQTVQANLLQTQQLAQEILPTFQKELAQEIEDFKFQANPRVTRIREQVQTLKQYLDAADFKKNKI